MRRVLSLTLLAAAIFGGLGRSGEPTDHQRVRELRQKKKNGKTLTPEEQEYLKRAMAERRSKRGKKRVKPPDEKSEKKAPPEAEAPPRSPNTGPVLSGQQKPSLSPPVSVAPQVEDGLPQYFPAVAYAPASKTWLVVWQDGLQTGDETARGGRAQDIYAARVSADGKVLDPKGIAICTAADFQGRPSVASDGKDFLVVWQDLRTGKDWDLYGARVTADGKVLEENGFLVAGGVHNQCLPDLVFGGGSYYTVWLDARHFPEYRVYGARVSASGKVLDASGTELIRLMTDKQREAWRKAPFASGKLGIGWHNFSRKEGGVRQPCAPSVATNGKVHIVTAFKIGFGANGVWGDEEYVLQQVAAASGRPAGPAQVFPVKASAQNHFEKNGGVGGKTHHMRLRHVPVGAKGFLTAVCFYPAGFGATANALWLATFLGPDGKPAGKNAAIRLVYGDNKQLGHGYRTKGIHVNRPALAWDGKRVLYVVDRYIQSESKDGVLTGDFDLVAIFTNEEGKRLADISTGKTVEPDAIKSTASTFEYVSGPAVTPFVIATGKALQANPAACAGPEGTFLVAWQEETLEKSARIIARLVRAK